MGDKSKINISINLRYRSLISNYDINYIYNQKKGGLKVFCPNCKSNYQENIEFCTRCGVRLVKGTVKNKNKRCPYCGVLISSKESECINCGELLNKSESNKITAILMLISNIPRELKIFKLDDRFIKTNLVIIVGIMGMIIIMMLVMN